jgi:hypothetical protein
MTGNDLARLAVAPELIIVRVIEHDLDALLLALLVQHPALTDPCEPATTSTLRRARRVADAARRLRAMLAAYQHAVVDAVTPAVSPDDLPF